MVKRIFRLIVLDIETRKMKFKLFKTIMSMTREQTEFLRKLAQGAIDKLEEDNP